MDKYYRLLFGLLRRNINIWQIVGFVAANLLGGVIVLIGLQAYRDFSAFLEKEDDLLGKDYLCIAKPVTGITTIGNLVGYQPLFNVEEIERIKSHPAVEEAGVFTTANFAVRGGFSLGDLSISSDVFLESVPTSFLDVEFEDENVWRASVDGNFIPVILPRKFLNIYNYGFAATKGLPQIGEGLSSSFPITIRIMGRGKMRNYDARIVGFTDRLNTILVPDEFLVEANKVFYSDDVKAPSKIIVAVNTTNNSNKEFLEFLDKEGYVIEGDLENLKLQTLIYSVLWVVIGIGAVVSLLAFFLLLISVLLLIEKNKEKFVNLYSLGFSTFQAASLYVYLVAFVDAVVWLIAAVFVYIAYPMQFSVISAVSPDFAVQTINSVWIYAILFALLFIVVHSFVIVRQVRRICV